MERTRDEVVSILRDRGPSSVAEVAELIGVSPGSVRRHMDIMVAEGLVEARIERQRRGRPLTRYSLSEAGEERSNAGHYHRLLDRLHPALAGLPASAVSGQDGAAVLGAVFEAVAESIARAHALEVRSADIERRVPEVVAALRGEGILRDAVDEGDAFRLLNVGCPYRSTAQDTPACCEADRKAIELLLRQPVRQLTTVAAGAQACEYLVEKTPSEASASAGAHQRGRMNEAR